MHLHLVRLDQRVREQLPAHRVDALTRLVGRRRVDFHVDDATVDVLDIPVDSARGGRGHSMYAVAARNDAAGANATRSTPARERSAAVPGK